MTIIYFVYNLWSGSKLLKDYTAQLLRRQTSSYANIILCYQTAINLFLIFVGQRLKGVWTSRLNNHRVVNTKNLNPIFNLRTQGHVRIKNKCHILLNSFLFWIVCGGRFPVIVDGIFSLLFLCHFLSKLWSDTKFLSSDLQWDCQNYVKGRWWPSSGLLCHIAW